MNVKRLLFLSMVALLAISPIFAANFTVSISGTLNPNLNSGPDCLGLAGSTGSATAVFSTTAVPVSVTATTATYKLAAGTVTVNGAVTNTKPWKAKFTPAGTHSKLVLSGPVENSGLTINIVATSTFARGSYNSGALSHPQQFSPSPQNLTQPSSNLSYSVPTIGCAATKLGFTGTASN